MKTNGCPQLALEVYLDIHFIISFIIQIYSFLGSGVLDFGKHISENPIEESVAIFIKTSDLGLGFEIRVKSWRSMFGIHGMDFESVILEAAFPPEQFPVPSEFTIAGKVKLHINNAKIDGE